MSLLSSNRLVVAIHPRGIDALRLHRGRLPRSPIRLAERQRFDVAALPDDDAPPWQRPLALLRELAGSGARHLHLVVSNHFVRYQLLPWESVVACKGDTQALAQARFQLAFGDAAAGWQVLADAPRFRSASLAAAIDGQLLASAREIAAAAGLQIAGIHPHLLAARQCMVKESKKNTGTGWFAVFEPGRLTVLGSVQGRASSLHNIRLHAPEALLPTLQQCVAADRLKSAAGGAVCLHAPGWSGDEAGMVSFVRLDGQEGAQGAHVDFGQAMAWCGSR